MMDTTYNGGKKMNKWEKASNFLSIELNKLMIFHFAEERQLLQELVERAEPMEVIPLPPNIKTNEKHGKCPYCQEVYIPRYTYRIGVPVNFCPNCGKRLSWRVCETKWSDDE